MSGFLCTVCAGLGYHGLPIELKALKSIGVENGAISPGRTAEALQELCNEARSESDEAVQASGQLRTLL